MRKSVFLRRIVILLLAAVLLAGILSFGLYTLITQRIYVNMRADELTPIAITVAEIMADAQQSGTYDHGIWRLLDRENRNFGASLYIYDERGESIMNPPGDSPRPGGPGNHPQEAPFDLSETDALSMLAADMGAVLNGSEVSEIRKSTEGSSYLVVGVPIRNNGAVIGAVFFTKAMSELNDTVRGLNLTLLFSTAAAFLIMLIPAYFATRRLVVPIRQMRDVAHAMAQGDFSVRADESQKGEIGELGYSINHFAGESERLEQTRRDYVSNVSHELRTPIASIRAMGETLRDGMAKTEAKKELFYNNIVHESMRLSRLVDDLLELSRLQAGTEAMQKSRFDIREVLQNITDGYGHLAENAKVNFEISGDITKPVIVFSNADRIEQLLVIFMDNAIKHTPEQGKITLSCVKKENRAEISVTNTGEEIQPEDLPHLFERFYKTDKSHSGGGTGLGLSIAKEIIKGLDEKIMVESEKNENRFIFTVELAEKE